MMTATDFTRSFLLCLLTCGVMACDEPETTAAELNLDFDDEEAGEERAGTFELPGLEGRTAFTGHTFSDLGGLYVGPTPTTTLSNSIAAVGTIVTVQGGDPATARLRVSGSEIQASAQEEQSADSEMAHATEKINVLVATSPVIRDRRGDVIGRAGRFSHTQERRGIWRRVDFAGPLSDPVVFAQVMTNNDPTPAKARVRNVTNTGFEMRVDEWNYQDGAHENEIVGWIALEKGRYPIHEAGSGDYVSVEQLDVGVVEANHNPTIFEHLSVVESLTGPLALRSQTFNGGASLAVRHDIVDFYESEIFVQEEEGADGLHAVEQIGYARITTDFYP